MSHPWVASGYFPTLRAVSIIINSNKSGTISSAHYRWGDCPTGEEEREKMNSNQRIQLWSDLRLDYYCSCVRRAIYTVLLVPSAHALITGMQSNYLCGEPVILIQLL